MKTNQIAESLESKFSNLANKLNKKKKIKYSLGLGEPSFNTPKQIIKAANIAMVKGFTRYSSPFGIEKLRLAIVKKYSKKIKKKLNIKNVIITPGSKMALSLSLMSILKDNDEIIYFSPCYTSYLPQILITNIKVKPIKILLRKSDFKIDIERLQKKLNKKTKAIIFNFPNNPTGQILDKESYFQIRKLLLKFKKCTIICDEIYDDLFFEKKKKYSFFFDPKFTNRAILINGFSKNFSMTGWRIGYCIADQNIIKKMSLYQQHISTNVPVFTQLAALESFKIKKNFLTIYKKNLLENFRYLCKIFEKSKKFKVKASYGGLFCFVDISGYRMNSDDFCSIILKKLSIAITPGIFFGSEWKKYVRISLAIENKYFVKAVQKLKIFLNKI